MALTDNDPLNNHTAVWRFITGKAFKRRFDFIRNAAFNLIRLSNVNKIPFRRIGTVSNQSHNKRRMSTVRIFLPFRKFCIIMLGLLSAIGLYAREMQESGSAGSNDCHIVIKTNLLYDALLTPDLGVEFSLTPSFSVGIEGVCAWWSNDRAHRYWRVRGGWLDASWWFGKASRGRRLTGHHAGIYLSIHDYDFEFGGKGWQSPRPTLGAGVTYGYSFSLNRHLNLDLSLRAGYAGGSVIEYRPMCGEYTCIRRRSNHYFGLTGIGVTLVWFPGWCKSCNP